MISKLINVPKYHLLILFLIWLGCILLLIGRAYRTGGTIGGDAVYYYANLRSLVIDRNLDLENEYQYFHNQTSSFTKNRKIPIVPDKNPFTKKTTPKYSIGSSLLIAPVFLLTHLLFKILNFLGLAIITDGYSFYYQMAAAVTSSLYAYLGLILVYFLGRKLFEPYIAFIGTFFIWFATPLIYYMTMEPLSSQPISFFCVSLLIYLWFKMKQQVIYYILLGLAAGFLTIVRYQDFLFILLPITDFIKKLPRKLFKIIIFLIIAFSIISIQLLVNNTYNNSPFNLGVYSVGLPYLLSPKILYSLFSFQRGLFIWSPILIFAFIGLYYFIKKDRLIGWSLFISFLLQLYITSSWADPSQGDSFGNRILLNCSLIYAVGLMQFINKIKKRQRLFLSIFTIFIIINFTLAGLYIFRIIGQPY